MTRIWNKSHPDYCRVCWPAVSSLRTLGRCFFEDLDCLSRVIIKALHRFINRLTCLKSVQSHQGCNCSFLCVCGPPIFYILPFQPLLLFQFLYNLQYPIFLSSRANLQWTILISQWQVQVLKYNLILSRAIIRALHRFINRLTWLRRVQSHHGCSRPFLCAYGPPIFYFILRQDFQALLLFQFLYNL